MPAVEYAMFCKQFLRLFGLYYFKEDSKRKRFLIDAWMWFVSFVFLLTATQALIQQLGRSEFELTRDSFGVLLICIARMVVVVDLKAKLIFLVVKVGACYHVLYYYFHRDQVHRLFDDMTEVFQFSSGTGLQEINMEETIIYGKKVLLSWTISLLMAFFIALWPLVTEGRKLALDLWYPFDWTKSPNFELTFLMQTVIEAVMLMTYAICDGVFPTCSALVTGQFQILGHNIVNTVNTALLQSDVPKDLVKKFSKGFNWPSVENPDEDPKGHSLTTDEELMIFEVLKKEQFDDTLCDIFKRYIEHHQTLLDYCAKLEAFFSPYQLIKIFLNRMYFCLELLCVMLFADADIAFVIAVALYAFAALWELFLQTYFGQRVQDEGLALRERLYEMPWYLCPKRFISLLKFTHLRSQRKLVFTMGKMANLDTETFVVFLNMVLSYATVLRNTMN